MPGSLLMRKAKKGDPAGQTIITTAFHEFVPEGYEASRIILKYNLNGRVITLQTLIYFTENLPADLFMRVHRSFIVAIYTSICFQPLKLISGKTLSLSEAPTHGRLLGN